MTPRWVAAIVGCSLVAACHGPLQKESGGGKQGATLIVLDSLELRESDTVIVAKPVAFTVGTDGHYFMGDMTRSKIYRFDRDGIFVQSYGRLGRGPGEMIWTNHAFVIHDTILAVADNSQQRLSYFHLSTGVFLRAVPVAGSLYSASVTEDSLYLGVLRVFGENHPAVKDAIMTGVVRGEVRGDSLQYFVRAPTLFVTSYIFRAMHNAVHVGRSRFGLAVAFSGLSDVLLDGGGRTSVVTVPAVRRRGVPDNPEAAWSEEVLNRQPRYAGHRLASGLRGLTWFSTGEVGLVFTDLEPGNGNFSLGAAWLAVLSSDRTTACVDAPISVSGTGLPSFTFQGDTLLVLDQVLDARHVRLRVRRMRVDTSSCDWLPLPRGTPTWDPGPI